MQQGELLQPGVEPSPSTVEAWNLSHWTTREVLRVIYLKKKKKEEEPKDIYWSEYRILQNSRLERLNSVMFTMV